MIDYTHKGRLTRTRIVKPGQTIVLRQGESMTLGSRVVTMPAGAR